MEPSVESGRQGYMPERNREEYTNVFVSDNPYVYHGAYGFCRDTSDRILLVRVASGLDEGLCTIPGGGIEGSEQLDTALLRELDE